jgi:hypothetical protein
MQNPGIPGPEMGKMKAGFITICSLDPPDGKRRLWSCEAHRIERQGMTQPMIAALIAVAVVALALIAVVRMMRPRQMTLPDYPELPAPPGDENSASRQG